MRKQPGTRVTLDLDDDLHAHVKAIANAARRTMGEVTSRVARATMEREAVLVQRADGG